MKNNNDNQDFVRSIKWKFRLLAGFYDLFDLAFLFDKETNPRQVLADSIPRTGLRILDVCVGTASGSIAVAEADQTSHIVGVDLSPHMVAVADKKIRKRGLKNISLLQMDAVKMSFSNRIFDAAMVSFGLHELDLELMMNGLKEINRVLKEDGKLYVVDYMRENGLMKKVIFNMYLKIFEPRHIQVFLDYPWPQVLNTVGFQVERIEKCLFSGLICAIKR